ncbi:hypothetical protein ANRL2_03143 [Anaerolineae bacterium]|nr:hypothetical protein ANRL2_03143 [Anaerolineae bacterium]
MTNLNLPSIPVLDILFYAGSLIFMMWPILLLSPLQRRRHYLFNMLFVWCFLLIVRLFLILNPTPAQSFQALLIPEPLNTVLFFAAGAVLGIIKLGLGFVKRPHRQRVAAISSTTTKSYQQAGAYSSVATPTYQQPGPSVIEAKFWEAAYSVVPEIEREIQIGPYRVDFLIRRKRLVIELYGHQYHSNKGKMIDDAKRERYLLGQGYHVMHFMGTEVMKDPNRCVREVLNFLQKLPETV